MTLGTRKRGKVIHGLFPVIDNCKSIGLVDRDKIYRDEAKDITDKCFELGVNPIHYNQGAWYIGSNSLQILLKNIYKIE